MAHQIELERLLALSEAPEFLPTHPHLLTVRRWAVKGLRGIRLETIFVGGRVFTSHEALARFNARLTAARRPELEAIA